MNNYLHSKFRVISIISTIFVVFVHSHNLLLLMPESEFITRGGVNAFIENFISQGIARVASPLFFLISGYLFFLNLKETRGWFLAKVNKRLRTLLVPYLIWSMWGIVFFFVLQTIPFTKTFFTGGRIADESIQQLLHTFLIDPIPYQLWFLRDLMMLIVISPIIYYPVKKYGLYTLGALTLTWFFEVEYFIFDSRSLIFFAAGLYFAINSHLLTEKKYPRYAYAFLFLWILLSLVKTTMYFLGMEPLIYEFIYKISVFAGLCALWCMYDRLFAEKDLTQKKIFPLFSFSFFIYTSHEPILTIIKKGLITFLGNSGPGILFSYFAAPAITIVICVVVGYFLKKNFHKFYYVISGGR